MFQVARMLLCLRVKIVEICMVLIVACLLYSSMIELHIKGIILRLLDLPILQYGRFTRFQRPVLNGLLISMFTLYTDDAH